MDGLHAEQMLFGFDRMRAAVDQVRLSACPAHSSAQSVSESHPLTLRRSLAMWPLVRGAAIPFP